MTYDELFKMAWAVREHAYAPYSKFRVGAAIMARDGRVFTGCNVENLSFGLTICAERAAVAAGIAAGATEFISVAVVADSETPVSPCGACRQVLSEFSRKSGKMEVRSANCQGEVFAATLEELLPRAKAGILGT